MKETDHHTTKKRDMIQSLQVGMSILEIISKEKRPLKYSEILAKSGMSQSNLYKYLNTLKELKFIYHNPFNGMYTIGPKIVEYGMDAINDRDLAEQLTPFLAEIRKELNETVHLNVFTYEGPMIVKMFTSSRPFNITTQIGTVLPFHSAAGKLFALHKNDPYEMWKRTSTEKEKEELAKILKEEANNIINHRIAFASQVLVESNASMAVPILDYENSLIASIVVVGFKQSIPDNPFDEKARYLIKKGKEISEIFGCKEDL